MDIVSKIIKAIFGSKADKDRKEIQPYVEKIKAIFPTISALSNDELRARSAALSKSIADFIAGDEQHIIDLRREIHAHPELGFDLPNTVAIVRRELDALNIPYRLDYAPGSVVATINPDCTGPTIALRADMDALPMEEKNDLPYASTIPGRMHSCGHDTHTAMLLGTARALKRAEQQLNCRVKLLFQPSEECDESGAQRMSENGVMDDVDWIVGQHVDPTLPAGTFGLFSGEYMAACHPYTIEFLGKSVHATVPQQGRDALAMAVKAYNDIYLMKARELDPFAPHILSISSIQAGHAHNIIAESATMLISVRFYNMAIHDKIDMRIRQICRNAADELGGEVRFNDRISCPAVINDAQVVERVRAAAIQVVGEGNVLPSPQKLSSEDFSHFLQRKPGAMIRIGTGNEALNCCNLPHTSRFNVDESALIKGSRMFVQLALNV